MVSRLSVPGYAGHIARLSCMERSIPLGDSSITCGQWISQRQRDDMVILEHRLSQQSYGRPRMTEELLELGLKVGHRHIGSLMRESDIKIVRTQKYKVTTDSNHACNIAPNLLDQNFSADGPNQKWASDIPYIWTSEGWLYPTVILDLYSRRVICWAVSNRMKQDLAIWRSGHWTRPWRCDIHRRAAFTIQIVARETVHMTIRSAYQSWALSMPSRACKHTLPGSG